MFKRIHIFLLIFFLSCNNLLFGQRVGLVLSGGGAKGAAHIGLIKALEDNEIPIDYISGTSIGAVVGCLYAMGYTPEEMLEFFLSKDFYYWQTGQIEENYSYYFRKPNNTPEFVRFMIPLRDSTTTDVLGSILPTNLINPIQMNLAFMDLTAQATAVCNRDFNKLFVPFLCVASDVYNKKPVIFRSGDLDDAVRASMTFPFVFKPIIKDSIPLYDGGLYDNFPIRPMIRTFQPDYIIGSSVAGTSRPYKMDRSLYGQLSSMMIGQRTDYSVSPDDGILFQFSFDDVGLLDFDRAGELYDIGYQRGLEMIDSVRLQVSRTVSPKEMEQRRAEFREKKPALRFKNIIINEPSYDRRRYIESQIRDERQKTFDIEDFKRAYFKLLANSKIKEMVPHARFNADTGYFDLILDVKLEDEIMIAFGGNISSSNANQFYLGLGYKSLTNYSIDFNLDLQVGNAFNGFLFQSRLESPYKLPVYLKFMGAYNYRRYYESNKLFIDNDLLIFMQQREGYIKVCAGLPFNINGKSEIRIGYGSLSDQYFQTNATLSNANFDTGNYNLFSLGAAVEKNTFDAKQFPIKGKEHYVLMQFITGNEKYKPGSRYSPIQDKSTTTQSWVQLFGRFNNYFELDNRFNLGCLLESVISSKDLHSNYTASVMQAPAFTPTPHSKLVFNEAFRANQYVAAGITPIYKLNRVIHLRGDFNIFSPILAIKQNNHKAYYGDLFSDIAYMGETSLVIRFPFLSVSLYGNYYSFPARNWNFGINIGYVIFNPKFTQ